MPLSPPADREPIHTRAITCRGYRRADGLWDIEGHLKDTKSYAFDNRHRGRIVPGEPIHEMWLRLTVDDRLTIVGAEAATEAGPFAICGAIAPTYTQLIGLRIGPGFSRKVKERLGGVHGCTHLTELTGPVATTAFQTIYPILAQRKDGTVDHRGDRARPPPLLNTCHAFASDGQLAKDLWPDFYTGP